MTTDPRIDIVAIASRDERRATTFTDRFGGTPFEGYDAIVEHDDVDAVYIPLPLMLHAHWAARCLAAGKHVLVEKPMSGTHRESSDLVALARSRDLVLFENYMFLHHSQHAVVAKLIADGTIGELRGFSSSFTIPPKTGNDIRYQREVGGGAFLDIGGYPVRAALHFLGNDLRTAGAVFRRHPDRDVVISGGILLSTPDGIPAQLTFGMEHSYRNRYSFSGSTGRISLDRAFTPPETHCPVLRIERQDHREELTLRADHQFARALDAFADAVNDEKPFEQPGTLEQAALIDEIRRIAHQ